MPFEFRKLELPGLILIEPKVFPDGRGQFLEMYRRSDYAAAGITEHFVQDNLSRSAGGVLRGLHYQDAPHAQGKLVRCLAGRILDVAVDIRRGSPSYGKWQSVELSGENNLMLYLPVGFAHGFLVLSGPADVLYKCTAEYSPASDRGIVWNDPEIGISWPVRDPLLSGKDAALPLFREAKHTFEFAP